MTSMSVSMSEQMRGYIKSRVETGDYHNESEYIRDLVRRDRERHEEEMALLARLRAAEASGVYEGNLLDIMNEVEERLRKDGRL